ncbi:MAG: PAS domain S-box protein, partial [Candidatus Bathyarchaeia archaeon]
GNKVIGSQTILRDITERKRVEKALRESEVKFKNIFESASDAMIYLDKSGRILDANPKAVEVFGGSKKELLGKHFTRVGIFSVRDVPQLMKNFANILTNKEVSIDLTIKNKKGKEIPLECSASLMKTGVMVIARDVTEKKKAEERLKFLKEFNERIIDSLGDAILIIDPYEYTILRVNEAALKQLKLRKEDLVGKTCYEKTHHRSTPCKSPHHICPIREVLKTGKAVKVEHTHFDKDNNKIVVEISAAPLRNEKGKIVQIVHLARDVTEKRIAEEKLRVMFESINDGVAIIDLEGNVVDANKAHLRMFGYNRKEELVGQNAFDSIAEKDRAIAMEGMMKMFEEEHSAPTEYTLRDKDGREFYAELTAALLHDSSGNPVGVVSVTRDITERKEMEKKLEEYSHQLEELVEKRTRQLKETQEQLLKAERLAAIGQVATMVGHDLRNPLQSIENATYYLNNELEHLLVPQKTKEMLQVLNDSVNYADRIIRDLQDFSTKKKPTLTKTNINAIVKKILSQTKVPENVKLIIKLNRLPEIEADKEMITRVFLNLATNALHAMENGGTLKVSSKRTNGFIEVSFKDTGIGIPKEKMEKLFTPFFTTKAKGMGMGLPICKKFVDAHRGSITVESKEGKGSTFTVRLPTKQ